MIGAILSAVLPLIVVMPVGPLIYFYTRSCVEPDLRLGSRDGRHFYPVVVDLFSACCVPWIYPTTNWQTMEIKNLPEGALNVDTKEFYVGVMIRDETAGH